MIAEAGQFFLPQRNPIWGDVMWGATWRGCRPAGRAGRGSNALAIFALGKALCITLIRKRQEAKNDAVGCLVSPVALFFYPQPEAAVGSWRRPIVGDLIDYWRSLSFDVWDDFLLGIEKTSTIGDRCSTLFNSFCRA
jgi:hypothetical protein